MPRFQRQSGLISCRWLYNTPIISVDYNRGEVGEAASVRKVTLVSVFLLCIYKKIIIKKDERIRKKATFFTRFGTTLVSDGAPDSDPRPPAAVAPCCAAARFGSWSGSGTEEGH